MSSQKKEVDQKEPTENEVVEPDRPSSRGYIQSLFESLAEPEPALIDLELALDMVVDLLGHSGIGKFRKDVNKIAECFARAIIRSKSEHPILLLSQMLQKFVPTVKRPTVAYRLTRFTAIVAIRLRMLNKPEAAKDAPKEEVKKEVVIERRKARAQAKREEAGALLDQIEALLAKLDFIGDHMLSKIESAIAPIAAKAQVKANPALFAGEIPSREALLKAFVLGLTKNPAAELRSEILQRFVASMLTPEGLAKSEDLLKYYRPLLRTATESEIEKIIAPQLSLLIKRSKDELVWVAPVLNALGPMPCSSFARLIQTTLGELLTQELSTSTLQRLFLSTVQHLASQLKDASDPKKFAEILAELSFPWKQHIGASEVEANHQLNFIKILITIFRSVKTCAPESRKAIIGMIVELFGAVKEDRAASESAVAISELVATLPTELCPALYETYLVHIIQKSLIAAKTKEIMTAFIFPLIVHGARLASKNKGELAGFLPGLTHASWKQQVAQLNLIAVTQSSYNIAVISLAFLLEGRDLLQSKGKEEGDATLLKYVTSPLSSLNKRDFISQRQLTPLDGLLHVHILALAAIFYPGYLEPQLQTILPTVANGFLQYAFSPRECVRIAAIALAKDVYVQYQAKKPEMAFQFAKFFQMAAFAFVKHANGKPGDYCPYVKKALSTMLHMFASMKNLESEQVQLFFLRFFILIHSSKANGAGKNKRKLCDNLWARSRKVAGVPELLPKIAPAVLRYMTSGNSLMNPAEGALVSSEQIQTTTNIVVTLARERLGKEVIALCGQLLNYNKLNWAEKLYEKVIGGADMISHFEVEFLAEEIRDLEILESNATKHPEEKKEEKKAPAAKSAGGKKAGKESKKAKPPKAIEAALSKAQREKENQRVLDSYVRSIVEKARKEIKSGLHFLRVLCTVWNTKDFIKTIVDCGILEDVRAITRLSSTRFEGYTTLRDLMGCLTKEYVENLSESYFASIIQSTSRKYTKRCTALFDSMAQTKIDIFDPSFIAVALDIADYLIDTPAVSSSIKSRAIEVIMRIMLETPYDRKMIHKITHIVVRLLKSTYLCDNLPKFLQTYWTRAMFNDMQDVMRNMCNFDLSHLVPLLRAVFTVKRKLPNASWMSNVMLQNLFSENRDMSALAKAILNERTLTLQEVLVENGAPSGLIRTLDFPAKDVRDSAVRSIAGYLEIWVSDVPVAVEILIKQYDLVDLKCRGAIADVFKSMAHVLPESQLKSVFTFLLTKGVAEDDEASKEFMESGIQIIEEQGKTHAVAIINAIEELIAKKALNDNANTIAVVLVGNVARYLAKDDPKLPQLYKTLQGMLSIRSEGVCISVAKCIAYFASIFKEEAKEKLLALLSSFHKLEAKSIPTANEMQARSFALAGYVQGLGIRSMDEYHIMNVLAEPYNEKQSDNPLNIARREYSLYAYTALSNTLGRSFEFFSVECMPHILQSFAAGKENTRQAAQQASKAIISKLSGQGVKSILPILVGKLNDSNWRSKLAAVECLGSMAFMAPKQLSNHLPKIVANIKGVLNDTQPKVHEAGIQALTAIGSVIKNPEIADISGKIIQTLKNPTRDLIFALDLLLQQSFAHAIDAPSLSLIIPILDYGLRAQSNEVKRKATQLVGNICKLIGDPNDMLPYMDVVMPALQSALFDPIPEVRSASAKALGALCKGLGLENMQDTMVWVKSVIQKEVPPVERSGAAQGYAEIIAQQGTDYLEGIIEQLIEHTRDKSPIVREGYLGVFLFLPIAFGDAFEKYFTLILPVVLEALTDEDESVRGTANRVVQICIRQYGKRRTDVLLEPLLQRMLDTKWKIRESALTLMADFLVVIENDMEREKPQYITPEDRDNIFATVFILRYDNVESIRVMASQVWKGIIDNQPKTLKAIMPTLIADILELVSKRGPELREVGVFTLHDLAEKYGQKLMVDILTIFKQKVEIEGAENAYIQGISICLYEMLMVMDARIVTECKNKIFSMLEPFIYTDEDELRNIIASAFAAIMNKDLDNDFQHKFAKMASKKLLEFEQTGETEKPDFLQEICRLIVKQRPKFGDDIIHILSEDPLTPMKIQTFGKLMPYLATMIFQQYRSRKLLERLFKAALEEGKVQDATVACFQRCSEVIQDEDDRSRWISQINDFIAVTDGNVQRIKVFLKLVVHMFRDMREPVFMPFCKDLFDSVMSAMGLEYGEIPMLVNQATEAITKLEAKENQHTYVSRIKREIDVKKSGKKNYLLPMFNTEKALDYLLPLFQNTLMHASVELRVDAASAYRYTIELTSQENLKNYAAKIAGSLIRVVNDKFPFPLKAELLECTAALMKKSGAAIRAFVSPLQTTMMKAVNDPELSIQLRPVILKNVTELLRLNPKSDSMRAELVSALNSPAVTTHATAFGVLAMVGKMHGATLKPEMRAPLFTQAAAYLAKLAAPFDEDMVLSIAFALSNLCHTVQEANMMLDLSLKKYEGKPEVAQHLLFAMLFMPYADAEPGSKFAMGLAEKLKTAEKVSVAKSMEYVRFFMQGISPPAVEVLQALIEAWVVSGFDGVEWEAAKPLLEGIPFSDFETMKIATERYMRLKCAALKYIARACDVEIKDGSKDLILTIFESKEDAPSEVRKLEENKILDHKSVLSLLRVLKY